MSTNINSKSKLTFRKKLAILGFTLYVTFILLSSIPYMAENQLGTRMPDEVTYNLVFSEDGVQSHYDVTRYDDTKVGLVDLTYTTSSHTLEVETTNIRTLKIDCTLVYYDEAERVYDINPNTWGGDKDYYFDFFSEEHNKFTVNVLADNDIEELRFRKAPKPEAVYVDGEEWWIATEKGNYEKESGDIVLTQVDQGSTKIELYFELLPPTAEFSIKSTNTVYDKDKNVTYGFVNQDVTFDASASNDDANDAYGEITEYKWDFGDDSTDVTTEDTVVSHKFTEPITYKVEVRVTNIYGLTDIYTTTITIIMDEKDKDMDGLEDDWEISFFDDLTQIASGDPDKDKLTNIEEFYNETDPNNDDSDNDSYSDYDEVKAGSDPNSATSKPSSPSSGDSDKEETDNTLMILGIVAVVIIILIILVLIALIKKRKKKEEEEIKIGAGVEGAEGGEGPVPGQEPTAPGMQMQPPYPGAPGFEGMQTQEQAAMYQDQYQYPPMEGQGEPGLYPPTPETGEMGMGMMEPGPQEGAGLMVKRPPENRPYQPEGSSEPPFYKADPDLPYSEFEEVSHEDLAMDIEGMKMAPEEGLVGLEEGLPPEEEAAPSEEIPLEEELPPEGVPEEEEAPPEDDIEKDLLDLGGDEEELLADEDLLGLGEDVEGPAPEPEIEGEPEPEPESPAEEEKAHEEEVAEKEAEEELTVKDYVKGGAIHFKDGNYTEAIIEWQKALDIEPDHPEIVESIKEAMAKLQGQ